MRVILFDLYNTLVNDQENLQTGALEMLQAITKLRDPEDVPIKLGLVSDFKEATTSEESEKYHQEYYELLEKVGLTPFFSPLDKCTTLSTAVGVNKPDRQIFQAALEKFGSEAYFNNTIFITECDEHIDSARKLGMIVINFKGDGQVTGEVDQLTDLVPIIKRFLKYSSCCNKRGVAVDRYKSQLSKSKKKDNTINSQIAKVSETRLRDTIISLENFETRYSYAPGIERVPEWIRNQFVGMGYTGDGETRFQPFSMLGSDGLTQRNVLCGPANIEANFILVCAHYDSTSKTTPETTAPGADDNASGIAVLLELAHILKEIELKRGIMLVAFGGEEQGLYGSSACAEIAQNEQWPIDAVINLDMIAYQGASKPGHIIVEYDHGNENPSNDAAAKAFGLMMAQAAADYTSLKVEHTNIWNSDYMPFEEKGYACLGVYEATDNPDSHKPTDTIDKIEISHLAEVTKMTLATIIQLTT